MTSVSSDTSMGYQRLGGIILAAGLSSRMGDFKPLIPIEGRSMIRRVLDLMKACGASPLVVVTGHKSREIEHHLEGETVEFVHNPDFATTQ